MRHTQGRWQLVLVLLTTIGATQSSAESDQVDRVVKATTVLEEIMGAPDKAIPHSVLAKAEGIAVFPSTRSKVASFSGPTEAAASSACETGTPTRGRHPRS